jgi:hypothetical protein
MNEPRFDDDRFMTREQAEADDTVDLHENDNPAPRYKRLLQRLLERLAERDS